MKRLFLLSPLFLSACSPSATEASEAEARDEGPLLVYTVNYPLAFFAEWIGGEAVRVEFPAPADGDPAFWSPAPETIVAFQEADLILLNGAGYAKWTERASLPASRIVDTSADESARLISEHDTTHSHGPAGDHSHGATAFTTWLDLTFAIEQARGVAAALGAERPESQTEFERRFAMLETELEGLDESWRAIVATDPGRPVLGSHPVYQYLIQRCGLNLESLHWEPDEVPGDSMWRELEALLETHPASWMLWEGEPLSETVERLKALGVESAVFDPCGNDPGGGVDFLEMMRANSKTLELVYGQG